MSYIQRTEPSDSDSLLFFHKKFKLKSSADNLLLQFNLYLSDKLPVAVEQAERCDVAWHQLGQVKSPGTDILKYKDLSQVMLTILSIPHSNAESERIFSLVRKNQTVFRPNLAVPMLESLLVVKNNMNNEQCECFRRKFSKEFLKKAKSATYQNLKAANKEPSHGNSIDAVDISGQILAMLDAKCDNPEVE
jgi:hypothetical protein